MGCAQLVFKAIYPFLFIFFFYSLFYVDKDFLFIFNLLDSSLIDEAVEYQDQHINMLSKH